MDLEEGDDVIISGVGIEDEVIDVLEDKEIVEFDVEKR